MLFHADKIVIRGDGKTRRVWINETEINPMRSQSVANHSPDGFNWGYGGSGPAQLALAILLELVDENIAAASYQMFKREFVAAWEQGKDFEWLVPHRFAELWTAGLGRSYGTRRDL